MGVCCLLSVIALIIDLYVRYVAATRSGINGPSDWRGFLPYPVLGLVGAVSSLAIGWVGLVLLVLSGIVSSEAFNVSSFGDDRVSSFRQNSSEFLVGSLFLCELVTIGLCLRCLLLMAGTYF